MTKVNKFLKKATGAQKAPARVDSKKHGLGRGLDGLLGAKPANLVNPIVTPQVKSVVPASDTVEGVAEAAPLEIVIADIERSPYQPRREFKDEELLELADSLKTSGIIQPPTVRKNSSGKYELIAGERRLRAAQKAGWTKIRVTLVEANDLEAATMTMTENLQREDLNPIEEAVSYKTLQDKFGLTQQEVAERVGKARATVANATRLLELPDEVRMMVQDRKLSVGHAKVILSVEDEKSRVLLARESVESDLTVRALERKVSRRNAPVIDRPKAKSDIPEAYARSLCDGLKRYLGCACRLTPSATYANGKRSKGVLEIDFFDNDDLDRIIKMIGLEVE
jgi:ParB family chromosome partitioning protein